MVRRLLEVLDSNHAAAHRLFSNWLGGRINSPRVREVWVCEQGITLKMAWGPSDSSPKSCQVFWFYFLLVYNSLIVFFSLFSVFCHYLFSPKRKTKHLRFLILPRVRFWISLFLFSALTYFYLTWLSFHLISFHLFIRPYSTQDVG